MYHSAASLSASFILFASLVLVELCQPRTATSRSPMPSPPFTSACPLPSLSFPLTGACAHVHALTLLPCHPSLLPLTLTSHLITLSLSRWQVQEAVDDAAVQYCTYIRDETACNAWPMLPPAQCDEAMACVAGGRGHSPSHACNRTDVTQPNFGCAWKSSAEVGAMRVRLCVEGGGGGRCVGMVGGGWWVVGFSAGWDVRRCAFMWLRLFRRALLHPTRASPLHSLLDPNPKPNQLGFSAWAAELAPQNYVRASLHRNPKFNAQLC